MCVSLITLGSLSSRDLLQTIQLSLPFARRVISQWIFVLFSEDEVSSFSLYLHNNMLSLDDFKVSVSHCSSGISASLNEGLSHVSCSWTLIVHSGDSLLDLDESHYLTIVNALSDPSQYLTLQIFGSLYDNGKGDLSITNHQRKRNCFSSMLPWIPHESTFVPSEFYLDRQYNVSFKSAMDFDFFHSLFIKKVPFRVYPFAITKFALGGTSSDVLLSCLEYRRSIVENRTFRGSWLNFFMSWIYFFFLFSAKVLFNLKSNLTFH